MPDAKLVKRWKITETLLERARRALPGTKIELPRMPASDPLRSSRSGCKPAIKSGNRTLRGGRLQPAAPSRNYQDASLMFKRR